MTDHQKLQLLFSECKEKIETETFAQLNKVDPALIRQVFEKLVELEKDINLICDEMWLTELQENLSGKID